MTQLIPAWIDGTLTPVEKLEVHRRGLRHKAISVFVMAGERVLLQRRAAGKYHTPGLWANTCCTHPAWDEAPLDCATRRLGEELGITGLSLTHRDRVEYRADVGGGLIEHEVVDIYTADAPQDVGLVENPEEVSETAWVALHDLVRDLADDPGRYTPWLRIYMDAYRDRIFPRAA